MSKATIFTLGFLGVLLFLFVSIGSTLAGYYNGFVTERLEVDTKWAQVESQYKRRMDLIPNLAAATRGLMKEELAVMEAAANRFKASAPGSLEQVEAAQDFEGGFAEFLGRLMVVIENYPVIKSDAVVVSFMDRLEGTENRIVYARSEYNEAVQDYNTSIQRFPANVIAGMFNFEDKPLFNAPEDAEDAPEVDLGFDDEETPPLAPAATPDAGASGVPADTE